MVTTRRITCSRSSCESVGDSPVVPTATTPLMPAAICLSIRFSKAATSIASSRNGVTSAVNVPRNISQFVAQLSNLRNLQIANWKLAPRLQLDRAFKNKLSRTGEGNIAKPIAIFFEIDTELAAAAHDDADWPAGIFDCGKNESARDHARAARERFVFHTTFIATGGESFRTSFLEELYVCALWQKHFVITNGLARPPDIDIVNLRNRNNNMRHSGVDKVDRLGFASEAKRDIQSQIGRLAHLQRYQLIVKLGPNHAGRSLKRNLSRRARDFMRETGKAARTVAAHFRFTAVAVKVAHPKVRAVPRFFQQQNSIGANAAVTIANACDLVGIEMNVSGTIVDHHEIVSGAAHLCESQHIPAIVVAAGRLVRSSGARNDKRSVALLRIRRLVCAHAPAAHSYLCVRHCAVSQCRRSQRAHSRSDQTNAARRPLFRLAVRQDPLAIRRPLRVRQIFHSSVRALSEFLLGRDLSRVYQDHRDVARAGRIAPRFRHSRAAHHS